jgi:Tripartite tricarboxylate transporter family receptor
MSEPSVTGNALHACSAILTAIRRASSLIGGQVQVMFGTVTTSLPHIRAGELRALAVTSTMRWETLPDLPTVNDFVPGYEVSACKNCLRGSFIVMPQS